MPRFLLPQRSSEHRAAAIALYRALLSRCLSVQVSTEYQDALKNVVHHQFRVNKHLQSQFQLRVAFRFGYEALDHLDAAAAGGREGVSFVQSIIGRLPRGVTRHPPPRLPLSSDRQKHTFACLPPERSVLATRPHQNVSGLRHVPVLASANGFPFLRLGKPQPKSLSRILRQKIEWRLNNFVEKTLLNNFWLPTATYEDQWDRMLEETTQIFKNDAGVRWQDAVWEAYDANRAAHERMVARSVGMARQMQHIVDQERELTEKEGKNG